MLGISSSPFWNTLYAEMCSAYAIGMDYWSKINLVIPERTSNVFLKLVSIIEFRSLIGLVPSESRHLRDSFPTASILLTHL